MVYNYLIQKTNGKEGRARTSIASEQPDRMIAGAFTHAGIYDIDINILLLLWLKHTWDDRPTITYNGMIERG